MSELAHQNYGRIHIETTPEQREAIRRRRAESDRNVDFWNEHYRELTERYLHRFLVIYNGGTDLLAFDDPVEMIDFLNELPKETADAAMHQYVDYAVHVYSYFDIP